MRAETGEIRHLRSCGAARIDDDGSVKAVIGASFDITLQVQADAVLRERGQRPTNYGCPTFWSRLVYHEPDRGARRSSLSRAETLAPGWDAADGPEPRASIRRPLIDIGEALTATDPRVEFLKTLAAELAPLGQTAAELSEQLSGCSDGLGLSARFFVLPTMVQIIYEEFGEERIAFVPVGRGGVDLETHALLESIAVSVGKGWISPQAGTDVSEPFAPNDRAFPVAASCGRRFGARRGRPAAWGRPS